jgi:hypothetical protein
LHAAQQREGQRRAVLAHRLLRFGGQHAHRTSTFSIIVTNIGSQVHTGT